MTENIIVIQEPASEASRYEFRVSAGVLQWRPSAAYDWRNLVNLSTLLNGDGSPIEIPDSDGIDEGVVHLFLTTAERSKLSGIATGAEVNVQSDWDAPSGDAQILNKPTLGTAAAASASAFAPASHTHPSADVSGLSEAIDDRVAALLVEGANITLTYNDAAGTITVASTGGGSGGPTAWDDVTDKPTVIAAGETQQEARDAVGAGTSNLTIGTSSTTAKAGDYQPAWDDVTDKPLVIATGATEAEARAAIDAAALDSPTFTGTPAVPTAAQGTNSTQVANTAFVVAAMSALIDSAPGALDTLNELAAAMGDDPNFSATIIDLLAEKQPLDSDLTAIAALTTTAFGRALLTAVDGAAVRTAIGAGTSNLALGITDTTAMPGDTTVTELGGVLGVGITSIVKMTTAEYEAIPTPDSTTLYVIVD